MRHLLPTALLMFVVIVPSPADDLLIAGGTVWMPDGTAAAGANVLISDGKIASVGANVAAPAGARTIDATGKHVCPGLIDAHSHLGLRLAETDEVVVPVAPDVTPTGALGADREALKRAANSGVTTVILAPGYASPIPGSCAAVKMGTGSVLKERAAVKLVLSDSAALRDREPTSMPGVLDMIRDALTEVEEGPLAQARAGELPVEIFCEAVTEAERGVALAQEIGLKGCILVEDLPEKLAKVLTGSGLTAVLMPVGADPEERFLTWGKAFTEAGIPVAFGSFAPLSDTADLRTSAAMAVGAGMPEAAAWRGLTIGAAEALGIADRVGSLEAGKDADVVIYSGEPLALTSAVELVVVDGDIIYEREAK